MSKRNKIVPAAYLIIIKDNKILLSRRSNTNYENGKYSLIGGHVEKDETFTDCAIREAKEEIDIDIKKEDLEFAQIMQRNSPLSENNQRIDIFFILKKWTGEIKNNEKDKCDDLSWFEISSLPKNIISYIREIIDNIPKKPYYNEYGY